MIYVAATCTGTMIGFVDIFRKILTIIQTIVPILLILAASISVGKLMMDPEDKGDKLKHSIKNSLIAALFVFLLPMILKLTLDASGNASSFTACWNAKGSISWSSGYVSTGEINGERMQVISNGSDYEPGTTPEPKTSPSSATSSTNHSQISKRIWVGDSRTVQMYIYVNNAGWSTAVTSALSSGTTDGRGDLWSCKGSMGYSWMVTQGVSNIEASIGNGTAIIILMGVNDCAYSGQSRQYASYINNKAAIWSNRGARTYFVSIMPTNGSYQSFNSTIVAFNANIRPLLSNNVQYIDAYSYLTSTGFGTTDGLHYDGNTYQKIYQYIINHL